MVTEIDAADVLSSYMSLMLNESDEVVRDIDELPYPKAVIKKVLIHCINLAGPGKEREFLRSSYVRLADFQPISEDQRASLHVSKSVFAEGASAGTSAERTQELARKLSSGGRSALEVNKRVASEAAALLEELKQAGC